MIIFDPSQKALLACVLLFWPSDHANAQGSATLDWRCVFGYRIDGQGISSEVMNLRFSVERSSGNASMVGNVGATPVAFHIGEDAFSFIEFVPSGAVNTTTIQRNGDAVHSRNTVLFGEFVAAQHFGQCSEE